MNHFLIISGASVYIALGLGHGFLTIGDTLSPRFFTPVDDDVRKSMASGPIRLNKGANLWNAWLGFNLSHSLGLLIFGGSIVIAAIADHGLLLASPLSQVAIIIVSLGYVFLAQKFWFWVPTLACSIGTCLFLAGFMS